MINIAGYDISMNSADGVALEIYFQGCHLGCKGCHNPELQEFKPGIYSEQEIIDIIEERIDFLEWIVLLGGDPLDQDLDSLYVFIKQIKQLFPSLRVKLYSGYEKKLVLENKKRRNFVYICDECYLGRYGNIKESLIAPQKL